VSWYEEPQLPISEEVQKEKLTTMEGKLEVALNDPE
jgi:hypothetical protein